MQNLLEHVLEGIMIVNNEGNILYYNKRFLDKLQMDKVDLPCPISTFILDEKIAQEIIHIEDKNIECNISFRGKQQAYQYHCRNMDVTYKGQHARGILLFDKVNECSKVDLIALLKNLPYCIWIRDVEGRFVFLNEGVKYFYYKYLKNYNLDEIIGHTVEELADCKKLMQDIRTYKDHQELQFFGANPMVLPDQEVIDSKSVKFYEEYIEKPEGQEENIWLGVCKIPICDEAKNVKFVVTIKQDITDEKRLVLDVLDSQKEFFRLKHLQDLEEVEIGTFYNVLEQTKDQLMRRLMADGLIIGLYNEQKEQIDFVARAGICVKKSIRMDHIAIGKEHFRQLLNRSEIWGIKNIEDRDTTRLNVLLNLLNVRSVGVYPIQQNGKIMGILLSTYQKEREMLAHLEDSFIYSICDKISRMMERSNLLNELRLEWFERKKAEEELESFLQLSTDLVIMLNQEGRIIKFNQGWCKILGWDEADILNHNWFEFIHPDDIGLIDRNISHIGRKESVLTRIRIKNGEYRWMRWRGKFMKEQGVAYLSATDVTKDKNQEEQRIIYETTLQKEKLKTEFFANISHEFKTPINIIVSAVQLIQAEIGDFEKQSMLEREKLEKLNKRVYSIKQNGYRLLRLVNNIIELTKIDSGYLTGNFSNVEFIGLIEDIASSTIYYLENKNIEFIFDTEVEELVTACDPAQMERIILNLLSNAAKYMGRAGTVWINIEVRNEKVIIHVKDNGIGIPKDKLDNIFERFTQVNTSFIRKTEGSGLGLAIVKSLVQAQKGKICVESEVGVGTEFILTFPIWQVEGKNIETGENINSSRVERCLVEFSDVYQAK